LILSRHLPIAHRQSIFLSRDGIGGSPALRSRTLPSIIHLLSILLWPPPHRFADAAYSQTLCDAAYLGHLIGNVYPKRTFARARL
jgi:hypothetical protein